MPSEGELDKDRALALTERVVWFAALFGGGPILFALVVLIATDVGLRYIFNSPIFGGSDYAQILLVVTVALSFAYSARTGGQVAVELFSSVASPGLMRWINVATKVLGAAIVTILAYQLVLAGTKTADYGLATSTLLISWEPYYYVLAFGISLYALVLLVEIAALIRGRNIES